MHYHFAIIGLPRSRTAWLANFFTYGRLVTCEHDAMAKAKDGDALREIFCRAPIAGISCSAASLVWDQVMEDLQPLRGKLRVLHVVRDVMEVSESLERCGHPVPMDVLNRAQAACLDVVSRTDSMEVAYSDLDDVGKMEKVWYFLTRGSLLWDVERWEMLKGMRVEIVWSADDVKLLGHARPMQTETEMLTQKQIDDMLNASREADEGPTQLVRRIEAAVQEHCARVCESLAVFVHPIARQGSPNPMQHMGTQLTEGEHYMALACAKRIRGA